MSNVAINIAAEFKGKKAFKEAATATDKLNKNVKTLGKSLLAVYSAQKLLSYAKASVKAFAEDDKAAQALGITLKNLGLAYGANVGTVNGFISRLESQTGVLDDQLRPAMDGLLRATGSVTKAQELLALSLDIAAGTGKSVVQVSTALQRAYLGQTTGLSRLGAGLTKTELATASFEEIQTRLSTLFAGQASAAADTYAGSLAKLTVAGENAKETIGKGLVDALVTASNSTSIDDLTSKINTAAEAIANFVRETGEFIRITKSIFKFELFATDPNAFKGMGNISISKSSQDTQRADAIAKKNATAITKLTKEQAAAQAKILRDKRLGAAIDKANLALNKGSDVFDMDKIQVAAALTNQAQQLGKATDAAQVLQIANDTARLNVKRSILALEDAIASKDEAAIIAATNKLNADLGVLNALTKQNTQMASIKSILESLVPKDLINQKNLDEALRKIKELLAELDKIKMPTLGIPKLDGMPKVDEKPKVEEPPAIKKIPDLIKQIPDIIKEIPKIIEEIPPLFKQTPNGITAITEPRSTEEINKATEDLGGIVSVIGENGKEFIKIIEGLSDSFQTIEDSGAFNALVNSFAGGSINSFDAGSFRAAEGGSIFNSGAVGSRDKDIIINVNTGIGDPNAIAEAIDNVLREAQQRGTLTAL